MTPYTASFSSVSPFFFPFPLSLLDGHVAASHSAGPISSLSKVWCANKKRSCWTGYMVEWGLHASVGRFSLLKNTCCKLALLEPHMWKGGRMGLSCLKEKKKGCWILIFFMYRRIANGCMCVLFRSHSLSYYNPALFLCMAVFTLEISPGCLWFIIGPVALRWIAALALCLTFGFMLDLSISF